MSSKANFLSTLVTAGYVLTASVPVFANCPSEGMTKEQALGFLAAHCLKKNAENPRLNPLSKCWPGSIPMDMNVPEDVLMKRLEEEGLIKKPDPDADQSKQCTPRPYFGS